MARIMRKKTNYRKKAATRTKPRYGKNQWKPLIQKSLRPDYSCVAYCADERFSSSSLTEYFDSLKFTLADIQNVSNYVSLWDQYRINYVVVQFIPTMTQMMVKEYNAGAVGNVNNQIPFLYAVIDRDDANPINSDAINAIQNRRCVLSTKKLTMKLRPTTRTPVIDGSVAGWGYKVNTDAEWYDCANPNIVHYGIKYAQTIQDPSRAFTYTIKFKYYLSFRKKLA